MTINTLRFGTIEVTEEDVIRFPEGLVGLSGLKRFCLLPDAQSPELFWLQSIERPEFALAVIRGAKLEEQFQPKLEQVDMRCLERAGEQNVEVFIILNRVEGKISANLMGPILINPDRMRGMQAVLPDSRFGVRHALSAVEEPVLAAG